MIVRKAWKPCPIRIGALIQRLFAHVRCTEGAAEGERRDDGDEGPAEEDGYCHAASEARA